MTKKSIIGLSIFIVLIVLTAVLFGGVFCLRSQSVKVMEGSSVLIDTDEIITTAGFKTGKSIFMLDKEKAIKNIESKYSHIKVVQIKTTSLTSIEFKIRSRHEMFYIEANEQYYLLDEDLKVLQILDFSQPEPSHLTKIINKDLEISDNTQVCDFVGDDEQQSIIYNLHEAMNIYVTKLDKETEVNLSREDIREILRIVEFEDLESYNKLKIITSYGVKLDIEKPQSNLHHKVNICFSTIEQFIKDANNKEQGGTIKLFYDLNSEMQTVYIP